MRYIEEDEAAELGFETRKRDRRAPKLKRRRRDLLWDDSRPPTTSTTEFADVDMQTLYDRGYFDSFVGELKGGKEATVFLVGRGTERLAAKVYSDIEARTFRNDAAYWSGFYIADARLRKAMQRHSAEGKRAQQGIWVAREYHYLWRLYRAGLPVPRPAVGPEASAIAEAGSVVLMEFLGDGDVPAPRLSDARLPAEKAGEAFAQACELLRRLTRLGLVHGDFSTYNLLWHDGRVWLIDVPQTVELTVGREALALLERDVRSLSTSFRRHGVEADAGSLLRELLTLAAVS